jgi:hypothetical protein
MPSAPMPSCSAGNDSSDLSRRTTPPVPVTTVTASTQEASVEWATPVPCVPVEIAPATVCASMSPRFGTARPCAASQVFSAYIGIPACTVTSLPCTAIGAARRCRCIRMSSAAAIAVNECPLPTTLTRRPASDASLTTAATSSTVPGERTSAATASWLRPQLRQRAELTEVAMSLVMTALSLRRADSRTKPVMPRIPGVPSMLLAR